MELGGEAGFLQDLFGEEGDNVAGTATADVHLELVHELLGQDVVAQVFVGPCFSDAPQSEGPAFYAIRRETVEHLGRLEQHRAEQGDSNVQRRGTIRVGVDRLELRRLVQVHIAKADTLFLQPEHKVFKVGVKPVLFRRRTITEITTNENVKCWLAKDP